VVITRETHNDEAYQNRPTGRTFVSVHNQGIPYKIVYFTDVNNTVICISINDCFCAWNTICFYNGLIYIYSMLSCFNC